MLFLGLISGLIGFFGIIWYHMVSYGIIWYHLVSSGIIWYHLVSSGIIVKTLIQLVSLCRFVYKNMSLAGWQVLCVCDIKDFYGRFHLDPML